MKKFIAALLAMATLLGLAGCKEAPLPVVEDQSIYARKQSNTLAAEQGEWMVLRAEKNGKAGLLLFHKEQKEGHFLLEGNFKNLGLLGNSVYFQAEDTGDLYRYDLETKTQTLLISAVEQYQIREDLIYYTIGGTLFTCRVDLGAPQKIKTGYSVKKFWLTDFGVYYYTAEKGLLMVFPYASKFDRIVCAPEGEVLDLEAIEGSRVAFIQQGKKGSKANILCSYKPANNAVLSHLEGDFSAFKMIDGRAVFAEGSYLCAVDLATNQKEEWGGQEAESVQLLSDCAVFYTGNASAFLFYPK